MIEVNELGAAATIADDGVVRTHLRTCPLCEAMCGLEIQTDGDRGHPHPRRPRRRVEQGLPLPEGRRARPAAPRPRPHPGADGARRRRRGARSPGTRRSPAARSCSRPIVARARHRRGHRLHRQPGRPQLLAQPLHRARSPGSRGMPVIWSAGTVDQWPKNVACAQLFGNPWSIPIPDVPAHRPVRRDGRQPARVAGLAALAAPTSSARSTRIRERGGRTIVIDPRRTGTAERADEWLPIMPGTDAAFLLGDRQRPRRRRPDPPRPARGSGARDRRGGRRGARLHARGRRRRRAASPADADPRAGPRAGDAPARAVVYGRIGLCNQEFGTLASWAVDVVNVLTGHLDVEGGAMFPTPAIATISQTARRRGPMKPARWHTRVRGAPEVLGQAPLSCLAEEIATPGDGQVRGADHDRRQPGALRARRRPARRGAADARRDDQRRQLAQRDHPPRPRDPARPLAARAAALRRGALGLRGAQRGALVAGDLPAATTGRTSGRS